MTDKILPPSISKCTGWWHAIKPGHAGLHALCEDCIRRTSPIRDQQAYVLPVEPIEGCAYKLTKEPT